MMDYAAPTNRVWLQQSSPSRLVWAECVGAFVTFSALPCAIDHFPCKVSKIAAGLQYSAAAILEDGQLFTWGENEHGELVWTNEQAATR